MKINELLVENTSSKVFQSMGSQLLQIGKDADKIKKHDPETLKQGIVKKLEQIDDPKLTHATTTFLQKAVKFNRNNPKTMAAIFGFTFAIIARVSMQISHHYGLSPTQATLIIEATLPTLGNFLGYLINGFSVKDSVQAGLIAGTIGVGGTIAASGALTEFAPTRQGGAGDDYLRVLASAWYNDTFNTGSLQKGIKSQEDVERLLQRGIVCNDGKKRKYNIGYNGNFDGVVIYSDDYYEYGDESGKLDSRTGKPWGPYEYIEYHDSQLDETKLNEFAPNHQG